jgi:hypothetical protein
LFIYVLHYRLSSAFSPHHNVSSVYHFRSIIFGPSSNLCMPLKQHIISSCIDSLLITHETIIHVYDPSLGKLLADYLVTVYIPTTRVYIISPLNHDPFLLLRGPSRSFLILNWRPFH